MKNKYIGLFTLVIGFGIISISMSNKYYFQPNKGTVENVIFAEDLVVEMQNKEMKVIELVQPSQSSLSEYRRLVAKQLPNAKRDPSIHFTVDAKIGLISFNRGMAKYNGSFRPKLPSPKEANGLSMKFLESNKLMPKNRNQLKLIHNGGLRAAYVQGGEKSITVDKLRTLTYGRVIDGIPVTGEGSRIVINVGDGGEIVSGIHKWKNATSKVRNISSGEMKSAGAAKEEIQKLIAQEFKGRAEIKTIKQVYYNGNGRFIQPVYSFEAYIRSGVSKKAIPYYGVIAAMKKAPEAVSINRKVSNTAKELIKKGNTKQIPKKSDSLIE